MNAADVASAIARMGADEKALLQELLQSEDPHQAVVLLELFHHFPGVKLDEPLVELPTLDADELDTQARWELFS